MIMEKNEMNYINWIMLLLGKKKNYIMDLKAEKNIYILKEI